MFGASEQWLVRRGFLSCVMFCTGSPPFLLFQAIVLHHRRAIRPRAPPPSVMRFSAMLL